ncbi:MAG TPA: TIGR03087 family PEP-CTERM/XrtA system glycosyltransferase [Planctomycetota bacterium]|nr:TIGR03087 family PEP-CTERM/XrtA system glycosyltransferase [Planctomycetota bacterium]
MRILFLSQRIPYPPNRGDKITTWRLIERMRRAHEVRVIAFAHDDEDRAAAVHLGTLGIPTIAVDLALAKAKLRSLPLLLGSRPLTLGVFGSKTLQAAVDREAASADLAYAYSSSMGAFLEPHASLKRVMHFAELDSDKWRQYAERSAPPMRWVYAREQRTLLRFESRVARAFAENVFCTPLEQKIFQELIPGASSTVLRNGVDTQFYEPRPERAEARHLVFVGVMDYLPNVDGCVFFAHEVLPALRAKYPDTRFTIVGSKPTPAVHALARLPGVTVTGFVDDPREWLARAAVSVAPLRIARGIQNKVLEALAMGLPVVGTTSATQGLEGSDGRDFLLADSKEEQIAAISRLFDAPDEARALGRRGREFVLRHHDWENVFEPLDRLLERLSPP